MSADIYTKCCQNPVLWNCAKKLINVFTRKDIEKGNFNPDIDWLLEEVRKGAKDPEDLLQIDANSLNSHYFIVMSGESSASTDFRKPQKLNQSEVESQGESEGKACS